MKRLRHIGIFAILAIASAAILAAISGLSYWIALVIAASAILFNGASRLTRTTHQTTIRTVALAPSRASRSPNAPFNESLDCTERTLVNRWKCAAIAFASTCAVAQSQYPNRQPSEEECLGLIGIMPTFEIPEMKAYYHKNHDASGKDMAQKLHSLADAGDKTAQFVFSNLLITGYCVPQDFCAARKYREQSRGGSKDWEKDYPIPPYLKKKYDEASCS
jgi:hypothetical protein